MSKELWFKIDNAKYQQPVIPIWPKGYLAFGLFLALILIGFTISAYGYYFFPSIEQWVTIPTGILIGMSSSAFLFFCKTYRSEG